MKWYVLRRFASTLAIAYLILSGAFFAFALTPDPNKQARAFTAAQEAIGNRSQNGSAAAERAAEAYEQARNRDRPLLTRYLDWMAGYLTLDLGTARSFEEPRPVESVLGPGVLVTALYVGPGIALSVVLSLLSGIYAGLKADSPPDWLGQALSYLGLGVPVLVLAHLGTVLRRQGTVAYPAFRGSLSPFAVHNLLALAFPAALVGFSLWVVQWRLVRAESLDLLGEQFVRTLRANGAGDLRLGRHVLKNALGPLLAIFTGEAMVVLLLTIYVVESVLGLPGLGSLTLEAFQRRDIGLILATVMLPVFLGLAANFLQDVVTAAVDPRVAD